MKFSKFKNAAKKFFYGVIIYAIAWVVCFAVSYIVNRIVNDNTTHTIHQYVLYAAYPLIGIGWVLGMIAVCAGFVFSKIFLGVIFLLKFTFPYCLYVIGLVLVSWLLIAVFKALTTPTVVSQQEQAAEERYNENMRVVKDAMLLKSLSDLNNKK